MDIWLTFAGTIIVSIISFFGVYISNRRSNIDMLHKFELTQARTDERLDALTHEVQRHNRFAERVPIIETKVENLEKKVG